MWFLDRGRPVLLPPALGLPPCTSEAAAKLALDQIRRENRFYQHLAAWMAGSLFFFSLDVFLGTGREFPGLMMSAFWAVAVAYHAQRRLRTGRGKVLAQIRELGADDDPEVQGHRSVEDLRRRLLRALEDARETLRQADAETLKAMSEGENQALELVAWLDRAEPVVARHRGESRLRRQVVARLAEPVGPADRYALARLRQHLEANDRRRVELEARVERRRDRVESLLLALEGLSGSELDASRREVVSASVRRRVEDLAGRDAARPKPLGGEARRIREEVRLAQELQRSILPSAAPRIEGLRVAHLSRPSNEVGGDFYDFYSQGPSSLLVAIGDASGHGIDSSMVSSMAKSALYSQVSVGHGPAQAMSELNRMLCDTLGRRRFMTLALLAIDVAGRRLEWVNAGQLYPLLRRGDTVQELVQPGYPLGVRRDRRYRAEEVAIEPGDLLLLVTDGLVEAVDPAGEPLGFERFSEVVQSCEPTAEGVLEALARALEQHLDGLSPQDDVTLLALEVGR